MSYNRDDIRPRLCVLERGSDGYGFHLHGERGKTGQFIRLVEPDSPSENSGLRAGDRLVFVNGENVENDSHQQVVCRIRATIGKLELIVVDEDTEELLKKYNLKCLREYATKGIPLPSSESRHGGSGKNGIQKEPAPPPEKNGGVLVGTKQNVWSVQALAVSGSLTEAAFSMTFDPIPSSSSSFHLHHHPCRVLLCAWYRTLTNQSPSHLKHNSYSILGSSFLRGTLPKEQKGGTEMGKQQCDMRGQRGTDGKGVIGHSDSFLSYSITTKAICRTVRIGWSQKGLEGYGFNLHSERSRPGQYVRLVDQDSPAQRSGLLPKDKIVQVNGVPVEWRSHSEVVSAIRAGGDQASLLVVDPETDAFFRRCGVRPTEEHLTGPLPVIREVEEEVSGSGSKEEEMREASLSVSLSPSSTSSNGSLSPTEVSEESLGDCTLDLNLSLQQVKERVHQKRSNKRAPQMDWSKKNELFSNL
ncbi:hypothetical protein JZ751_013114 [Albula glossodonta]|uniref:Na(+)/H(+) exchange regulatory cofactor NHE-RF1 n=1 Tax=Albula glossodonta TaxID=121402 RepID=A0A8T2NW48_9TELE|nr:hypothetical protein JZ751_013114 [Albula glossodonta]